MVIVNTLFQRSRWILTVFVSVIALLVLRNSFYMFASNSLVLLEDVQQRDNDPQELQDLSRDTVSSDVGHVLRQYSPVSNDHHGNKLNNDLKMGVNNTVVHDPKIDSNHTLLKANMSHVGDIVKQLKADKKRELLNQFNPQQPGLKAGAKYAKPHPFKYVINSPNICGSDPVFILAYIHTAPDHYKRRTVIRQTWGKVEQYQVTVRLVFVMGLPSLRKDLNETNAQKALFFESEQYGDIVQEDFLDTYHNLTHKGVTALKWISIHCKQAVYILKTDDDIFVNTYTLIRHLTRMQSRADTKGVLMCAVWYQMTVLREGKWKVTKEEWPASTYPTYCSGSAFIMSTDVAIVLHAVSYHVPFFWVDDFYITGLLPLKAGNVKHRSFGSTFVLNGDKLEEMFTGPQWFLYIFSHVHNLNRIQAVWDTMTKLSKGELHVVIPTALPGQLAQAERRKEQYHFGVKQS